MRVHAIGIGGAGARIADTLYRLRDSYPVPEAIAAIDTDRETIRSLESLPEENTYFFGDDRTVGGLGGDLDLGREIGEEYADEIDRALDRWLTTDIEAVALLLGLGGATGGGVAPALIDRLHETLDVPVYAIGALPAEDEVGGVPTDEGLSGESDEAFASELKEEKASASREGHRAPASREAGNFGGSTASAGGPIPAANAAETIQSLTRRNVPIVGFDNELWLSPDEHLAEAHHRLNERLAVRLAVLFGAGDRTDAGPIAQQVIDASDVDRVLGDEGTIATIGYATIDVERPGPDSRFGLGLFSPKEEPTVDTSEAVSAIETAIRKAARGKQTLEPIDGRAERTLLVVGGPPEWLNRKAIAQGRRWIADETGSGAVLHGDDPTPDDYTVFAVVLRAGIESERLRSLRDRAQESDGEL